MRIIETMVEYVFPPTKFHEFPLLALLHFRGELELGQDVLFKQQDDFTHCRLQNGASCDLVQACEGISAIFPIRTAATANVINLTSYYREKYLHLKSCCNVYKTLGAMLLVHETDVFGSVSQVWHV